MEDLRAAVNAVLRDCLDVRPGEDVLVIVDEATRAIGEALRAGARALGAEAVLAEMDARAADGTEPPDTIAAAMLAADVVIAPTSRSLSHTRARVRASQAGVRSATMPDVTEEMLARTMAAAFEPMAARSRAVAELLSASTSAHLSCPRGTNLMLELGDRGGTADDGVLSVPGAFGNLPCGEAFIAPVGGEGRLVGSSIAALGLSEPPATLVVEHGRLVAAHDGLGPELLARLSAHGAPGTNLAELGIGTNDRARLGGRVLEDEKILGSAHIAFGASAGIGGTVSVPIHIDVVVVEATLQIGDTRVLESGRFVLGAGP